MKRALEDDSGDPDLRVGARSRPVYWAETSLLPSSSLQWVELCPSKIHVKVLTTSTSERKLNWEECHCIRNSLRQGLAGGGWAPNPMSGVLGGEIWTQTHTRGKCHGLHSSSCTATCQGTTKAKKEAWNRPSSSTFRKSWHLALRTSSLRSCETINFCEATRFVVLCHSSPRILMHLSSVRGVLWTRFVTFRLSLDLNWNVPRVLEILGSTVWKPWGQVIAKVQLSLN